APRFSAACLPSSRYELVKRRRSPLRVTRFLDFRLKIAGETAWGRAPTDLPKTTKRRFLHRSMHFPARVLQLGDGRARAKACHPIGGETIHCRTLLPHAGHCVRGAERRPVGVRRPPAGFAAREGAREEELVRLRHRGDRACL